MSSEPSNDDQYHSNLRSEAVIKLARTGGAGKLITPEDELLHELQVHQIELEMQNEELRRAHAELEESRDRYVDLYEFAPIGYLTLTRDGLISEINLTGAAMLGEMRNKVIGRRFAQYVAAEDRDRWHRHLLLTLQQAEKQNLELSIKRGDGNVFHAGLDCLRIMSGISPVVRIALGDISERKQAEQILKDADRHKSEFLAMLAHELRNPLVPLRNAAYVIGLLELDEPKIKWAQKLIENQVGHLSRMVDDLLDISRITFNKIKLRKETVDFAVLSEHAIEFARPLVESKRQRLVVRLPEQPVQLEGDPVRLPQVLFNLLENASKYSPEGGLIELDASRVGQEIEIRVRDKGAGIPSALLPRVFDLFMQGECSLDRPQGGLGIGLSLVKHLVMKHGGRVEASSPGQGLGATFTVWLPISGTSPSQATISEISGVLHSNEDTRLRVLVVDDDHDVADSTTMLLDMVGYDTRMVDNGLSALELIPQYLPQVVLLDIGLKGLDGFETAKRIRELPQGRDLRLLAVTGYGDEETKKRAMACGCDDLLVKPMQWSELMSLEAMAGKSEHSV